MELLENQQSTSLERNKVSWAFPIRQGQVYLNELAEKQAYAYLNIAATFYLMGQESEAQTILRKVRQQRLKTMPGIVAVVGYDLDRVEAPRESLSSFLDLVRRELLAPF